MEKLSPTAQLTWDLIRRRSLSPDDAGCQELLIKRLEAIGFTVTRLPFGDAENFWAVRGESGPILALAGHTDVVPPREELWDHPPFEPHIDAGMLYGCGAADMKAGLAALITASERFVKTHANHAGRLAFLVTSDEEGKAENGTKKVVEWLRSNNTKIKWCLLAEPSSTARIGDVIKNGRRGSLSGYLRVFGVRGHIAYPHLADNPIHRLAPILTELLAETWDTGNDHFPPTSFQVSDIRGGTGAVNVIPGEVELRFNFRFSPEVTEQQLRERTETILKHRGLDYSLSWTLTGLPFLTARGKLLSAVENAINLETGITTEQATSGGTSDGRFVAIMGTEVVELGHLNATIHQTNERVRVEDIDTLSAIFERVLERLLGETH